LTTVQPQNRSHQQQEPAVSNILNVSLDQSTTPWTVNVEDGSGQNEVLQSTAIQMIIWQLIGAATPGAFPADPNHAIRWPFGLPGGGNFGQFGGPIVSAAGDQLMLPVLNDKKHAPKAWIYELTVVFNGVEYHTRSKKSKKAAAMVTATATARTTATTPTMMMVFKTFTNTNPTIVNK
jgi:hypothetical protein